MICEIYPESLFLDWPIRGRLTSLYWVRNLSDKFDYQVLCDEFYRICPHLVSINRPTDTSTDAHSNWEHLHQIREWCAEYTIGLWIDSNFPAHLNISALNFTNTVVSFELEVDAIMFKLKFI